MLLKWLLCGMGGSKCLAHFYLGRTHDVVMHNASSSIALKFHRDLMVRSYRYIEHHMLPEKGYGAASYP
jgi:hypothetical protein